ncbi:unnamed protein product [Lymnaea stagnalis]|uniref:Uncharacterized protein n=1 Tax=Lymnaea stagnalis TaxID=6523 RepID=A0AAV2IL76_LYMST
MSTVDEIFSKDLSSYSQQNGDVQTSNNINRATLEKIKSVHENPFYKQLGIKHNVHPRNSHRSESSDRQDRERQLNGRFLEEDNDVIEYRPGSGFVTRLLDKFTSLTAKEAPVGLSHLKRSSSLDELPAETAATTQKSVTFKEPSHNEAGSLLVEKPSNLSSARLSQAHKARSVDGLNYAHRRSSHQHASHNLPVSLRHVDTKWNKPKPSRDSHIEAPDVELARDDIIIIEKTPPIPTAKELSNGENECDNNGISLPVHHHENLTPDELPKPNTVLTVRNLFENAPTSNTSNDLLLRRRRPESSSISPLSTTVPAFFHSQSETGGLTSPSATVLDGVPIRASIHSPSPVTSPRIYSPEAHAKPVLLPAGSKSVEHSRRSSDSSSLTSRQEDEKPTASVSSNIVVGVATPSSISSLTSDPPASLNDPKPTIYERSSYFGSAKNKTSARPTPTPRTTASVKPTVVTKPSASVKPVPLSAPASAATSYKKSSPVVPVAPFKDKQEDAKDDGQPVMIFNKSKLSPRREKPQRLKDYGPVNDGENHEESKHGNERNEEQLTIIIPKDAKKVYEKEENVTNNKVLSQRKVLRVTEEQETITQSTQHTTIEIKTTRTVTRSKTSPKSRESTKQRAAPQPPPDHGIVLLSKRDLDVEATSSETNGSGVPSKVLTSLRNDSESRAEISIKTDTAPKAEAPVQAETPFKTEAPVKESLPIKGIPSIIAQRLKQQNSDPSQVAGDVVSSQDTIDGGRKTKLPLDESSTDGDAPSARKRLTPTNIALPSETSSINSEIENEIAAVRKKMEGNRSKSSSVSQIFDSSQLAKKRKENQKQRAAASVVPPLDLSGITDDVDYQPQQREIKPCNIKFIGENAKTDRSLLVRSRKIKVSIHFNDSKTETFEYPSEEWALEKYMNEHPNEPVDIVFLEENGGGGESSDDIEMSRVGNEDETLKSNTSLSHSGNLQSYRGRFQQDYQFGSVIKDPEPAPKPVEPVEDPDSMMLRPAEEDDTNTWSTNDSSDLLF